MIILHSLQNNYYTPVKLQTYDNTVSLTRAPKSANSR